MPEGMPEPVDLDSPLFTPISPRTQRSADTAAPAQTPIPAYTAISKDTFVINFGKTITKEIEELSGHMIQEGAKREQVVFTALRLMALSLDYDLEIRSARGRGTLEVADLWKPERGLAE